MIFSKKFIASFLIFLAALGACLSKTALADPENRKLGEIYMVPAVGYYSGNAVLESTKKARAENAVADQCKELAESSANVLVSVNSLGCLRSSNYSCSANCVIQVTQRGLNLQRKRNSAIASCVQKSSPQLAETRLLRDQFLKICRSDTDSLRKLQCSGVAFERRILDGNILSSPKYLQDSCELARDEANGEKDIIARLKGIEMYYRERIPNSSVFGREVVQAVTQIMKKSSTGETQGPAKQSVAKIVSAH